MTRIEKKFAALKDAKKKGLVIYLMAGVPDAKGTIEAVKAAERAGADFIEIGLPFSDPLADGPVIQAAGIRALKGGMTLAGVLELVREIRKFTEIPLIGMGYINNVLHYGAEKFVADAKAAGLDGAILPDVPHEESAGLRDICAKQDFRLIEFVTPGTTPDRLAQTCESANGFIYAVSVNGVTGIDTVRSVDTERCYAHKGAEVKLTNEELADENCDRSSLLCIPHQQSADCPNVRRSTSSVRMSRHRAITIVDSVAHCATDPQTVPMTPISLCHCGVCAF